MPAFPLVFISLLSLSFAIAGPCALSPPSSCDRLAVGAVWALARLAHGVRLARTAEKIFLARGLAPQLEVFLIAAALSARCGTTVSDGETECRELVACRSTRVCWRTLLSRRCGLCLHLR